METTNNEISVLHHDSPVAVYDRINDPMTAVKTLGQSIFKSGLFGLDRPEQGEVLAMECLAQRKSPLELARTYHFIGGQLAIRSDALLAKYQLAGGQVNWTVRTDEEVQGVFSRNGQSVTIIATMKEYIANGTAVGKDGKPKDNWRKWPRRMLTARAISEGVRLIAPECCFGTYTVEELDVEGKHKYPTVVQKPQLTIDELIPESHRDVAIKILREFGILDDNQGWSDLPIDWISQFEKSPRIFLQKINERLTK